MIQVRVSDNVTRVEKIYEPTVTIRFALEDSGIGYTSSVVLLDGAPLDPGDLDATFESFGYGETGRDRAYLSSVVKACNA